MLEVLMESSRMRSAAEEHRNPSEELEARIAELGPCKSLIARLERAPGILAEIKRSSPSSQTVRRGLDPVHQASLYQSGGAAGISILTEPEHFCGSLEDLAKVRESVELPLLRKDFITTPYQVLQARAGGADLILLIVAGLEDDPLKSLYEEAQKLGLEVLVECHDEAELERAVRLGSPLVGINSRNLKTLQVDLAVPEALLPKVPENFHAIAESGVQTIEDAQRMAAAGARGLLVGTALIESEQPSLLLQELEQGLREGQV